MKRALWFLLGWWLATGLASAAGLIIVHDPDFWRRPPEWWPRPPAPPPPPERRIVPPPERVWAPLEVAFTKADVRIRDQIASTMIDQEFYNPNARQIEGTFLFPVPKGAQVRKFTMEINGKPVEAELLEAEKARGIYEDIVRKLRDPALLEYAGRDLFKVRIFPIEPHARKRITLSYTQLLKADHGLVSLTLPLNTEKFSSKPVKNVSVKVELEAKRPLKSIYSPSHKIDIKHQGANQAIVSYESSDVKPDTDFQLFYSSEPDVLSLSLLAHKSAGTDGYFLLLASPGVEAKAGQVIPKDVTFVLDTSGSMAGAKLEQAKKALAFCVENLNEGDRFEVLRFATEVEGLFEKLADAGKENRARAQEFIKDLKPLGGTAIDDALKKALELRPETGGRPFVVIFLTDGKPTVGATGEDQIVENVKKSSGGHVRVFCFGIGHDVNTHLLDKITEETRAYSQYVLPEEDIEIKVSSFFTKVKDPVLANPKITFPDTVRVTKVYPSPVPDFFKGEQLVLAGRYSGRGDGVIQIEGTVSGETKKFVYEARFPDEANDHEFIPRLWATRRVGYLLDEIRLRGESKELKDEVTDLARKYSIVTPYTAYLIVEDEGRRGLTGEQRTVRFGTEVAQREAQLFFKGLQEQKDGAGAVAGARSYLRLKSADAPADAIVAGGAEVLALAPADPNAAGPVATGRASLPARVAAQPAEAAASARQLAAQAQFIAGKSFFQNESGWMDSDLPKSSYAQKARIQFGSPEYFSLLRKHPKVQAWLALGSNVQFVHEGTAYEIYE